MEREWNANQKKGNLSITYRLARYQTPGGQTLSARLPASLQGAHFGPTLRSSFILYQHHHQRVTQPLLWQQLRDWGIDLSRGQLHRLITEDQTPFHQEKDALLNAGLGVSTYLHADDTGARHAGKNGYCTHLGNEHFAVFHSTDSKSRINFLQLLRGSHTDSVIVTVRSCRYFGPEVAAARRSVRPVPD